MAGSAPFMDMLSPWFQGCDLMKTRKAWMSPTGGDYNKPDKACSSH